MVYVKITTGMNPSKCYAMICAHYISHRYIIFIYIYITYTYICYIYIYITYIYFYTHVVDISWSNHSMNLPIQGPIFKIALSVSVCVSWVATSNVNLSHQDGKSFKYSPGKVQINIQWIGLRENFNRKTPKNNWENLWFPVDFPLNQSIEIWYQPCLAISCYIPSSWCNHRRRLPNPQPHHASTLRAARLCTVIHIIIPRLVVGQCQGFRSIGIPTAPRR